MTLAQMQTFVRNIIGEPAGDIGLVDDVQLVEFINVANEKVWMDAVARKSSLFMTRSSDQTITSSGVAYSAVDASLGVFHVAQVEQKIGSAYYTIDPLDSPQDRGIYEPTIAAIPAGVSDIRWYVEKDVIYVTPVPSSSFTIRVVYIPGLADIGSGVILQGRLTNYHHLVGYEAACMIFGKDEQAPTLVIQTRDELRKSLARHLTSMTSFKQRGIHHVPYV